MSEMIPVSADSLRLVRDALEEATLLFKHGRDFEAQDPTCDIAERAATIAAQELIFARLDHALTLIPIPETTSQEGNEPR